MAKAAKAEGKPKAGKAGKSGKAGRERSVIDDLITLTVCVACTVWAFKTIVSLGVLSF